MRVADIAANHLAWSCRPSQSEPREAVLVIAEEPLRSQLAAAARERGYEPVAKQTPLDAITALERLAGKIAYAVISSQARWGLALRELLADEYPNVRPVMLVA